MTDSFQNDGQTTTTRPPPSQSVDTNISQMRERFGLTTTFVVVKLPAQESRRNEAGSSK
jgi:hypothetical protein